VDRGLKVREVVVNQKFVFICRLTYSSNKVLGVKSRNRDREKSKDGHELTISNVSISQKGIRHSVNKYQSKSEGTAEHPLIIL